MNKYVYIPLLILLFVLYGIDAKSEDCSSVNLLVTHEENGFEVKFDDFGSGHIGTIDFKYRPPSGFTEGIISIDWSTLREKHPAMSEESIKDFVLNAILRKLGTDYGNDYPGALFGVYSSIPCYSTLNCVYKIDTTRVNCCDKSDQTSPINSWEINGEKFISIPFARYICSIKCCKTFFRLQKYVLNVNGQNIVRIAITRNINLDQVISECSPGPNVVAPHCLLSSDPNSPYYVPWDPNPLSSTCEGGCP